MFDRRLVFKGFGPLPDGNTRKFVLRGVSNLAKLLGCDEAAAVLQYKYVLPYMLQQMAPSQPLADCSNQEAWASLLRDEIWETACPRRIREAASGALTRMIRFYISIEDGECTVERDLGHFRKQRVRFSHDLVPVHEDYLLLKLCGPATAAEFNQGTVAANHDDDGVTPASGGLPMFTRECAKLWRTFYSARFGHFNAAAVAAAKAQRRAKAAGTFGGTVANVLAAARVAVVAARRRPNRRARVDDIGAGTSESVHWNEAMSKFRLRSRYFNVPGCSTTRAAPGAPFMLPARVSLGKRRAAKQPRPAALALQYGKVAFLGVDSATCSVDGCPVAVGRHRCAEADLVVVEDLGVLHDVEALSADEDLAVGFLYVVLRGLDVTTKPMLSAAGGRPRSLAPLHCVCHVPVSGGQPALRFWLAPGFVVERAQASKALRNLANAPGSNMAVEKKDTPSRRAVCIRSLRELVDWAVSARRVANVLGPKAFTASGAAMSSS